MRVYSYISGTLLFLWVFLSGFVGLGQPDSLFNLDNRTGTRSLEQWFKNTPHKGLEPQLIALETHYRKQKKPFLERYAWLAGKIIWVELGADESEVERRYLMLEKEVAKKDWPDTEGELWIIIGSFYSGYQQFGKAFEYCLRGFYRFEELGFDNYPHLYRYLGLISDIYYRLGDWSNCLKYLLILNNVSNDYIISDGRFHIQNSIALVYRNLNRYDSSAYFFKASYQSAKAVQDSFWMALSLGNLGYNYFLQGSYDKAMPLLEDDFRQSWKVQEYESATNAGLSLVSIYLKKKKFNSAIQVMDSIKPIVFSKRHIRWMRSWFENQFQLSKQNGNLKDAVRYADSALTYKEIAANNANMQILANTRSKVDAEKYLNQISLLESNRQKALLLRNALIGAIALITVILLLILNRINVRHRFSLEKAALEKKQANQMLEQVQEQLNQYTGHLREKTLLIEQVERELEQIKAAGNLLNIATEQSLGELLQSSILTEEEWQRFRALFEKVHPGFLIKIRQQFPDLTPAETRIVVLTRLKLTNKEMMTMLGIGYDAIKKTRQRLRKKISLPDDETLDHWIEKI